MCIAQGTVGMTIWKSLIVVQLMLVKLQVINNQDLSLYGLLWIHTSLIHGCSWFIVSDSVIPDFSAKTHQPSPRRSKLFFGKEII